MYSWIPAYGISKVALNALPEVVIGVKWNRILVNSVDHGWIATDMRCHRGRPFEEGAIGIVWASTLQCNGPHIGFFCDGKPKLWG